MTILNNTPALRFSLLLVIGVLVGKALDLPLYLLVILTASFLLIAIVLFFSTRSQASSADVLTASIILLCILAGATKITFDTESSLSIPDSLLTKEIVVIGQIDEPPSVVDNRKKFVLNTSEITDGSVTHAFDANLLATVKRKTRDTIDVKLEYGMCIALKGKITRPSDVRNPGEFSARQYYEANGISWMVYVRGFDHVVVLDSSGGWWLMQDIVVPARNYVIAFIDRTISGDEGEFLKGILIGERSGISPSTKESFRNSGVAHVLAVSGAHVAVVAVFLFFLVQVLRLPKAVRIALTSIGLLFYMLLTGSNPPVVRATIMALVILFGGLFQEKRNIYNSLGVAALIILAMDARQLFDVGFQLSFVAVFSIVYLYPRINSWFDLLPERTWWHRAFIWTLRICAVSTAAIVGTLPLTAIYFGRVSLIGVASNIIVMPAVGLSVTIGLISVIASVISQWVGEVYAGVNQLLLHGTLLLTDFAGNLSFAYVDTLRFSIVHMLPFYAGVALLFHLNVTPVARKLFILFLVALNISVFYPSPASYASSIGKLRVSVIDVGQGDAILVEFPDGKTMLVDAGPRAPQYDAGERVVVPFLKRRNVSTVDLLVVSHPDNDHIGGVPTILDQFDVKRVIDSGQPALTKIYRQYLTGIANEQCLHESTRAGTMLKDFAGARLYFFYPTPTFLTSDTTERNPNLNNTSVVIKLQYGSVSFLLAGDVEKEAEDQLVVGYGDFLKSTVLKVGHHGSKTSSTHEFLEAVEPSHAVISVGQYNWFGHPSRVVLQRLEDMSVDISRTDEEGAIIFETDGTALTQVEWR